MRNFTKRTISLVMVVALLALGNICTVNVSATKKHKTGDIIELGSYPQTLVSTPTLINALNQLSINWVSYGYYVGEGKHGTMVKSDYMKYADVVYNGEKYRAVTFTNYRPYITYFPAEERWTNQKTYGYTPNNIYWFKFNSIKWVVLDPEEGLIVAKDVIDSQPYCNTVYLTNNVYYSNVPNSLYINNYEASSIREWLNNDFYHTAFKKEEKDLIKTTKLDNSSYHSDYSMFDSSSTNDKVFLPSYNDFSNVSYGFNSDVSAYDNSRMGYGTDYARCQGLKIGNFYADNACNVWLRNPGKSSRYACEAYNYGALSGSTQDAYYTYVGVRPAISINLNELVDKTETYTLSYSANGGSGAASTQTGAVSYTVSSTQPTRSGYTFLGWSKSSSATTASYTAGDSITLTANTTLYAVWQKNAVVPTPDEPTPTPAELSEIKIKHTSTTAINYGDTLILQLEEIEIPEGMTIAWFVEGAGVSAWGSEDGLECRVMSIAKGNPTIYAKLVDEDETPVTNADGEEIFDEITLVSKAGFWQRFISFFKNLFGINRVIY